ncbi:MAG: RNA 2',3'-cyclic phosphodiesterase [Bacteroidota bacterium]
MQRLFLGIPVPVALRQVLHEFQQQLGDWPAIKWVPPVNFHITVYFFGGVPEERLENLQALLSLATQSISPFVLEYDRFVLAPKLDEARMIWARYHKTDAFREAVQSIHQLYEQIEPEQQVRKSPIPHITLARLRRTLGQFELPSRTISPPQKLAVKELVLWESILEGESPEYRVIRRYPLQGA